MNKELEKQLIDLAVGCAFDPNGPANKDGVEELKSFIDKHFVAKEKYDKMFASMAHPVPCDEQGNTLYTKEQVLEMIGEDAPDLIFAKEYREGYNQAKAEIREKL